MKAKYPGAFFVEVLKAPASAAECASWTSTNNASHLMLRDDGQVASNLQMSLYQALVLDRWLNIVQRGNAAYTSGTQTTIDGLLARLK